MPSTEIQDYWRRAWGIGDRVGFQVGGQFGATKVSRLKNLQNIKAWFNQAIAKGPVSMSDLEKAFPKQARFTISKALGTDVAKITRATPLQTKFGKTILKIIDDVYANKKPLINASPSKIFQTIYKRPFNIKKDNISVIKKVLNTTPKYAQMSSAIANTSTRVSSGNKLFEKVKFKDFNKLLKKSLKDRGLARVSGNIVEQNVLRDLIRHIRGGGTQFAFATGSTFDQGWKGLKIKDLAKGDILTQDKIRKLLEQGDSRFTEYLKKFKSMKKLKSHPYIDPITKEKTTLLKGLKKATKIDAPLHIQHNKGVVKSPLKSLSILTHKANIGANMVKTAEQAATLGVRTTLPGGKKVVGPKISFEGNVDRLTKFADRKILQTEASGFVKSKTPTKTLTKKGLASLAGKGGLKALRFVPGLGIIVTAGFAGYGIYDAIKKGYMSPEDLLASAVWGSGVDIGPKNKVKTENEESVAS